MSSSATGSTGKVASAVADPVASDSTVPSVFPSPQAAIARRQQLDLPQLFDLRRPPGYYNEAARAALLRRGRRGPHDQLLVDFAGPHVLTELVADDRLLWSSYWTWQATVDGQALAAASPWEEVCWHTDGDVDYLELELKLSGGWLLSRQALLARKDRFLLLADSLTGSRNLAEGNPQQKNGDAGARIDVGARNATEGVPYKENGAALHEIRLAGTLSLAPGIQLSPAQETREAWLTAGRKRVATIVPLALPEWRAELSPAELLASSDGSLVLTATIRGRNLCSPLWIDLDSTQTRQPLTWRRLTVAEDLQVVRRDVAVGYRVQLGQRQWLVYRSLDPRGNRTVLGRNYSSEFVCCQFLKTGGTGDIIEIQ